MTDDNYPFHVRQWPRSIAAPLDAGDSMGGEALSLSWDLGAVSEAEKKQITKAWVHTLPTLRHLKRLRLWTHVTQPVFEAACQLRQLEVLQIKWSNVRDLSAISGLQQLRALSIGSSTKVPSIEPLIQLQQLKLLELENFKSITDFSPLVLLTSLDSLAITGSMWSSQAIESLEPFGQMTWLRTLSLDTSSVSSLKPLARLKNLRELGLGGRLPFEEYAWLSAQLPTTACRWFAPFYEMAGSGYSRCVTCQQDSMVMLTGRGKPVVCRHCDAQKVAKHVAAYLLAKARATPAK